MRLVGDCSYAKLIANFMQSIFLSFRAIVKNLLHQATLLQTWRLKKIPPSGRNDKRGKGDLVIRLKN